MNPPTSLRSGLAAEAHLKYKRLNDQLHAKCWKNKQGLLILNSLTATAPLCSPRLNVREERVARSHLLGALFTVCQKAEWPRKGDWLRRKKRKKFTSSPLESCSTGLSLRQKDQMESRPFVTHCQHHHPLAFIDSLVFFQSGNENMLRC